jgi:hypothetical protein
VLVVFSMLPVGAAWAQEPPVNSAQQFVLVGVVLGRSDGPMAVVKDRRTGREAPYHVGDEIQDVTLLAVAADRAVLRAGGHDIELRLATSPRGGDVPVAVTSPPRRAVPGRAVPGRWPVWPRFNR